MNETNAIYAFYAIQIWIRQIQFRKEELIINFNRVSHFPQILPIY